MEAHRIGSHSNVLEDICAVQEENVVSVWREGGAQGCVQRRIGGNREGASWADANIDLQNAQELGTSQARYTVLNSASSANSVCIHKCVYRFRKQFLCMVHV